MNLEIMQKIVDCLNKNIHGLTIINLMEKIKISRGSIKTHLDILVYTDQVKEIKYAQNVKVFFGNVKKVRMKVKK